MPTKKPILQAVVDPEIHEKFKQIAELEHRKLSNMGAIAIEKFVKDYEAEHGEIKIPEN